MLEFIKGYYRKLKKYIDLVIFPLILLLWPLVKVNQGVDLSDSTYSLANYLYPASMGDWWRSCTFLSTAIGQLLVRLPGGDKLIIINIYMGLVLSATALVAYYALRKEFGAVEVFFAEFLAINLTWIPYTILYNYLSYFMFTLGTLLLYFAIQKNNTRLYYFSGLVLGLNVFVRLPNAIEAALIVAVWIMGQDKIKNTLRCIAGYLAGAGSIALIMVAFEGEESILGLASGLQAATLVDSTYTFGTMLKNIIMAYIFNLRWAILFVAIILAGTVLYAAFGKKKSVGKLIYLMIICSTLVLYRFLWGRGVFSFRFYEDYTAMYFFGMLWLILGITVLLYVLVSDEYKNTKIMAILGLVIIIISPLGSNNSTYQNLNNMFLILPVVVYVFGRLLRKSLRGHMKEYGFAWKFVLISFALFSLIMTSLFHLDFVFRDGIDGSPRKTELIGMESLIGMRSTDKNMKEISSLLTPVNKLKLEGIKKAVFLGNCPGLSYLFKIESAIDSPWPDLASYSIDRLGSQMDGIIGSEEIESIAIIIHDTKQYEALGEKKNLIDSYIADGYFEEYYNNDGYIIMRGAKK